jgi:hypothetical protein
LNERALLVPFYMAGGATSFRVATRSLHRSSAGGLKASSLRRMGGLNARAGKIEKSDFLQKSDFWGEVNSIKSAIS